MSDDCHLFQMAILEGYMKRFVMIAAAVAISLTTAGPVGAEDQSKQGDPMLVLALEESFAAGMKPNLDGIAKEKHIPADVTDGFIRCYARTLVSFIDTTDASLWNAGPEVTAKISTQVLGGLAPSIINGSDPLAKFCPKEAQAFRAYL